MRTALLIANPSASGFTGGRFREVLTILGEAYHVTPAWPNGPAESRQRAAEAAAEGFDLVIAMGGDGVVHHVANGLVGTPTTLGILPAGTINVVARLLGIPQKTAQAAHALLDAEPRRLPVVHMASDGRIGARSEYAVFSVGIGLDADVVGVVEQRPYTKYAMASLSFAKAATAQVLGTYRTRAPNMVVECGQDRAYAVSVLVQVHDVYTYFGRLPLRLGPPGQGPTALAAERLTVVGTLDLVRRAALRGSPAGQRGVRAWSGFEKLVIEADPQSHFQADGELLGPTSSLEVTPVPEALTVLAPVPVEDRSLLQRLHLRR
jgi:diacylglycerol kinase family enzyme